MDDWFKMSKRRLADREEDDVISKRRPNYWTYGLNLRRVLDPEIFVDGVLCVVLEFCGSYRDPREVLYFIEKYHLSRPKILPHTYVSLEDAEVAVIEEIGFDYRFHGFQWWNNLLTNEKQFKIRRLSHFERQGMIKEYNDDQDHPFGFTIHVLTPK